MKKYRILLLLSAVLLLSTLLNSLTGMAQDEESHTVNLPFVTNGSVSASDLAQLGSEQPTLNVDRPPLSAGSPVQEIVEVQDDFVSAAAVNEAQAAPVITLFYGDELRFGHVGNPQRWVNVLGNASPANQLESIEYRLNGGQVYTTTWGPGDRRRLALAGDFNIELDYATLNNGQNLVEITATTRFNDVATETVTVTYEAGNVWPMPYTTDWGSVNRIEEDGQVIDGEWELTGNGIRPVVHRYDRLVGFGDDTWENYEAVVPVTITGIDADNGYRYPSVGPGIGLLMNWSGHYQEDDEVPTVGWRNFGSLSWHRWTRKQGVDYAGLQGLTYQGAEDATDPSFVLAYNTEYIIKMRSENQTDGSVMYRYKMWKSAESEPAGWNMEFPGNPSGPKKGSLLFVAHHVDAVFGDLSVRSLADPEPTPTFTETPINTPTFTPVPSNTAIITPTMAPTVEPTAEPTATPTFTLIPTHTATLIPIQTPLPGSTATPTPTSAPISTQCWTLQIAVAGDGAVPTTNPTNSVGCATGEYLGGEMITLQAQPDPGWVVHQWVGVDDADTTESTVLLTMPDTNHWAGVTYAKSGGASVPTETPATPNPTGTPTSVNPGETPAPSTPTATPVNATPTGSAPTATPLPGTTPSSTAIPIPTSDTCFVLTLEFEGEGNLPTLTPPNSEGCPAGSYRVGTLITIEGAPTDNNMSTNWSGTDNDGQAAASTTLTMPAGGHLVSATYSKQPQSQGASTLFLPIVQTQ